MRVYLNGIVAGSRGVPTVNSQRGTYSLQIGDFQWWLGKFSGLIDEIRIYNRAFSADEIKALYEATK